MKYFKMKEFECSDGCVMPASVRENIEALVENVLDPARERLGMPIRVNSGYRCARHNAAVGGVVGSQHLRGEAADIAPIDLQVTAYGLQELERLKQIIVANGKFDQLIIYPTFIHVSWKWNGQNRKQVLRKA